MVIQQSLVKKILSLVNHVMQKCVNYENNPKHYKLSKNIDLKTLVSTVIKKFPKNLRLQNL